MGKYMICKFIEHLNGIREARSYGLMVSILSDIDHDMTKMSLNERFEFIKDIVEEDLDNIPFNIQVNIAATLEHVYNELNLNPPDWVIDEKYSYQRLEDSLMYREAKDRITKNWEDYRVILIQELEDSLPEFRWRKVVCDGIFDSY